MSNEALQRTVRRVGAVLVFAIAGLTSSVRQYATYEGVPMDIPGYVMFLLLVGPVVYLAGSFLVGTAATLEAGARAKAGGGDGQDAEAPE
jgi:hypothetical protein